MVVLPATPCSSSSLTSHCRFAPLPRTSQSRPLRIRAASGTQLHNSPAWEVIIHGELGLIRFVSFPEPDNPEVDPVLVVVGGGAAGIFGALRAKSECPRLNVVVLEKAKLLSKVCLFPTQPLCILSSLSNSRFPWHNLVNF